MNWVAPLRRVLAVTKPLGARTLTCVAYHHFSDDTCDATRHLSSTTSRRAFREQLDYFERNYRVVGLDQVLSGDLPRNALLITFDDSYRSVLDVAAPELARRKLPSVHFINPGPIASPVMPLDNLLSLALVRFSPGEIARAMFGPYAIANSHFEIVQDLLPRYDLGEIGQARETLLDLLNVTDDELRTRFPLFLEEEDLRALQDAGVEIGSHTINHVHCRSLNEAELRSEIVLSKNWIEKRTGRPARGFSFPWGSEKDATPDSLRVVRECGHSAIFLAEQQSNWFRPAADVWDRASVSDETSTSLRELLALSPPARLIGKGMKAIRDPSRLAVRLGGSLFDRLPQK